MPFLLVPYGRTGTCENLANTVTVGFPGSGILGAPASFIDCRCRQLKRPFFIKLFWHFQELMNSTRWLTQTSRLYWSITFFPCRPQAASTDFSSNKILQELLGEATEGLGSG